MYPLFAFIGGQWYFGGIEPHEEHAVMFIEEMDNTYGEGTAQVYKLPDKSDHSPTADAAEAHANFESFKNLADAIESGELDLDTAFKNFRK